jgi:outer membrane lipoprotein SlyB
MSRSVSFIARVGAASLFAATLLTSGASAQQPQPVRIRGTIESVDGAMLTIKDRDGQERKVKVTDNVTITGVVKTTMAEVKPGSYIGVTGQPQPDGTQKAIAIHIFPEAMRGTGEGSRPWDLRPNSSMTNATVDQKVEASDGQTITVKYKDGEKKVTVTPDTPIVTFVPGDKSELKAGAKVIIMGATKKEDGSLETARVNVGRDGITPPM